MSALAGQFAYLNLGASLSSAFANRMAMWDWDVPRGLVFFCPNGASFFGLTRAEAAVGCSMERATRLVHHDDAEGLSDRIRASLAGGRFEATYRVGTPEAGYRRLHTFGACTVDERGSAIRFPGIAMDISDLPEIEPITQYDVACDHLLLAHQAALKACDPRLAELCERALLHVAVSTATGRSTEPLN